VPSSPRIVLALLSIGSRMSRPLALFADGLELSANLGAKDLKEAATVVATGTPLGYQ